MERDETGMTAVQCPATPGGGSQGCPEEEALASIREAIAGCPDARAEEELLLTVAT